MLKYGARSCSQVTRTGDTSENFVPASSLRAARRREDLARLRVVRAAVERAGRTVDVSSLWSSSICDMESGADPTCGSTTYPGARSRDSRAAAV
jgi:hypothetical protein